MENLDLTKILKDCPQGTKLYSPLYGEVMFYKISYNKDYPIVVQDNDEALGSFMKDGRYYNFEDAECMLFPSKDCRDWSQFVQHKQKPEYNFKPFDRVLVRDTDNEVWRMALFEMKRKGTEYPYLTMYGTYHHQYCIPYEGNESLLGTVNDPE
jgi:hypothetical protein